LGEYAKHYCIADARAWYVNFIYDNLFQVADWCLRTLNLLQYADRCAGKYSGGNKRKLSTAISLVGECPIIFLVSQNMFKKNLYRTICDCDLLVTHQNYSSRLLLYGSKD
jgi:ABC-type Na+ transport system ATPase subunit NatA